MLWHNLSMTISIHALREEGDRPGLLFLDLPTVISIHALREEGDRRATHIGWMSWISIHALREEGDWAFPLTSGLIRR